MDKRLFYSLLILGLLVVAKADDDETNDGEGFEGESGEQEFGSEDHEHGHGGHGSHGGPGGHGGHGGTGAHGGHSGHGMGHGMSHGMSNGMGRSSGGHGSRGAQGNGQGSNGSQGSPGSGGLGNTLIKGLTSAMKKKVKRDTEAQLQAPEEFDDVYKLEREKRATISYDSIKTDLKKMNSKDGPKMRPTRQQRSDPRD